MGIVFRLLNFRSRRFNNDKDKIESIKDVSLPKSPEDESSPASSLEDTASPASGSLPHPAEEGSTGRPSSAIEDKGTDSTVSHPACLL